MRHYDEQVIMKSGQMCFPVKELMREVGAEEEEIRHVKTSLKTEQT